MGLGELDGSGSGRLYSITILFLSRLLGDDEELFATGLQGPVGNGRLRSTANCFLPKLLEQGEVVVAVAAGFLLISGDLLWLLELDV